MEKLCLKSTANKHTYSMYRNNTHKIGFMLCFRFDNYKQHNTKHIIESVLDQRTRHKKLILFSFPLSVIPFGFCFFVIFPSAFLQILLHKVHIKFRSINGADEVVQKDVKRLKWTEKWDFIGWVTVGIGFVVEMSIDFNEKKTFCGRSFPIITHDFFGLLFQRKIT